MVKAIEKDKQKSRQLANFNRRYVDDNDKDIKMPDVKHMAFIDDAFISERTTFTQSRSGI